MGLVNVVLPLAALLSPEQLHVPRLKLFDIHAIPMYHLAQVVVEPQREPPRRAASRRNIPCPPTQPLPYAASIAVPAPGRARAYSFSNDFIAKPDECCKTLHNPARRLDLTSRLRHAVLGIAYTRLLESLLLLLGDYDKSSAHVCPFVMPTACHSSVIRLTEVRLLMDTLD